MRTISLVLTIYKQPLTELCRWLDYFEEINNLNVPFIQTILLNDNPNLNEDYKFEFNKRGFDFPECEFNRTKSGIIQNAVDTGIIKTDYIKICDPDDYFDIENFFKHIYKILNDNNLWINVFQTVKYTGASNTKDYSLDKFPVNYNTIYITSDIRNSSIKSPKFTVMDDVYYSILSMINGRKIKYWNDVNFYIWNENNGISHEAFSKSKIKYKIYDDLKIYNEYMNFFNALLNLENYSSHYFLFGNWFIKAVQNSIISSREISKYSLTSILKLRKFLVIYKKIYNEKKRISKLTLISAYVRTWIGKKI